MKGACKEAFVVSACWKKILFVSLHMKNGFVYPSFVGRVKGFWGYRIFAIFLPGILDKLSILLPRICHNGILCSIFCYCQGYWIYRKKIWEYLPVHKGYFPVYFQEYNYIVTLHPLNKLRQCIGILVAQLLLQSFSCC